VKPDPVIIAINRYRAARAEVDKIAVREPMLPNGNPADETEEYATWETANLKATDATATAWTDGDNAANNRRGRDCAHRLLP
jgi:hypothetical protein